MFKPVWAVVLAAAGAAVAQERPLLVYRPTRS
jgi:hypothetical protein